jgi:hypothetical protein
MMRPVTQGVSLALLADVQPGDVAELLERAERPEYGRAPDTAWCKLVGDLLGGERAWPASERLDDRAARASVTAPGLVQAGEYLFDVHS